MKCISVSPFPYRDSEFICLISLYCAYAIWGHVEFQHSPGRPVGARNSAFLGAICAKLLQITRF